MISDQKRRLIKNTSSLYLRTFVTLFISLFISREVLDVLGVIDYGIYSLVGSLVVFLTFFNGALSYSAERFLALELGKNNLLEMKKIFSLNINLLLILILLIVIVSETLGIWIINSKLNIPINRIKEANLVFHISIITFCISMLRVPFKATIVAYERMGVFASLSITESVLKLLLILSLRYTNGDKLVIYSTLILVVTLIINLIYVFYCRYKFTTCQYIRAFDKKLLKRLIHFLGWNLLGKTTNILTQNGLIFLLNIFFGVTMNSALAIANQVNGAVVNFISGFQTSFIPQIIKLYAEGKQKELHGLVNQTSKFSFILVLIPALILIRFMPKFLDLWLTEVPEYTVEFCRFFVIGAVIDATTGPYYGAIMASGKIRNYQIGISISFTLDLVFTYILLELKLNPGLILISRIFTRGLLNMVIGLYFLKQTIHANIKNYLKQVLLPIIYALVIIIPYTTIIGTRKESVGEIFISSLYISIISIIVIYFIVLNSFERKKIRELILGFE